MNDGTAFAIGTIARGSGCGGCSAWITQQRSRLALIPLAKAMAAKETRGYWQAATAWALNSALCLWRRRRLFESPRVFLNPLRSDACVDTASAIS